MITAPMPPKAPRPYWHVDAKWIAGIALFFSLSAGLLFYNLANLTERDQAINLSTTVVASLVGGNQLDSPSGLKAFRVMAARAKGSTIAPLSEFPSVTISKHDALTMTASQIEQTLFRQITGPVYDLGVDAAAQQFTRDPAKQQQFAQNASALNFFTKSTHQLFQSLWLAAAVVSLLMAGALVYFSARWGRLASPGFVLLAVSPIGSIAGLALLYTPLRANLAPSALPSSVTQAIGNSLSHSYLIALILGIALLAAAFLGKIVSVVIGQRKNSLSR